jgi:hypothetical protein
MLLNRGGRQLLYLSRRVNGKPKKIYVGTGPLADLLAAELEARKRARKATAEACAAWKAKVFAVEEPLDELCADLEQLTAASLLARGYHRHHRGPWRKKREYRQVQDE